MKEKENYCDKIKVGYYIDKKYLTHIALIVDKRLRHGDKVVRKSAIIEEALDLLYKKEMGFDKR